MTALNYTKIPKSKTIPEAGYAAQTHFSPDVEPAKNLTSKKTGSEPLLQLWTGSDILTEIILHENQVTRKIREIDNVD